MEPLEEKIIILMGMLVATFFFAMIPFKLVRLGHESLRKKILSYASCFSGGVFLAACILDLFPDIHEAMDNVLDEIEKEYHTKIDYPVAGFVICLGFFLVLTIEQIILTFRESSEYSAIPGSNNAERTPLITHEQVHNHNQRYSINSNDVPTDSRSNYGSADNGSDDSSSSGIASVETGNGRKNCGHGHEEAHNDHVIIQEPNHSHAHDHGQLEIIHHSTIRSLLLLIALSFHSVFEGLAIGLQKDLGQLISLFLAVIAHKAVMAFSLGLNLAQANLNVKQYLISIIIFSIASPFGMAIGMGLSDMDQSLAGDIGNSILQGLAGGTFLYITFFEVLPHEMESKEPNRMIKLAFVLLGFAIICGLLFIVH